MTALVAWPALAVAALALPACSREAREAPEAPRVRLSTENPDGNARAVAEFARDVCIAHIGDPGAIAEAVEAKRWPAEENVASAGQLVTVRDLEHGRIAYSAIPFSAPGGRFDDCQIELDGAVAPSLARVRPLLERALRGFEPELKAGGADRVEWSWRVPPSGERQLSIAASAPSGGATRPGLVIHVSSADYTLGAAASPIESDVNAMAGNDAATSGNVAAPPR